MDLYIDCIDCLRSLYNLWSVTQEGRGWWVQGEGKGVALFLEEGVGEGVVMCLEEGTEVGEDGVEEG